MALQPSPPSRYVKAIRYDSMTDLLTHFRQILENENGKPIQELDNVNAAMILSDLCVFLGLSGQNRRKVLGAEAAALLDSLMLEAAKTALKH